MTAATDEDGRLSYTFHDKGGQSVLIRRMNGSETLDTYYVYDAAACCGPCASESLGDALSRRPERSTCPRRPSRSDLPLPLRPPGSYRRSQASRGSGSTLSVRRYGPSRFFTGRRAATLGRMVLFDSRRAGPRGSSRNLQDARRSEPCAKPARRENARRTIRRLVGNAGYAVLLDGQAVELAGGRFLSAQYYDSYDFLSRSEFSELGFENDPELRQTVHRRRQEPPYGKHSHELVAPADRPDARGILLRPARTTRSVQRPQPPRRKGPVSCAV